MEPLERLKHFYSIFLIEPNSIIADEKSRLTSGFHNAEFDYRPVVFLSEFPGVLQQIFDRDFQKLRIGFDYNAFLNAEFCFSGLWYRSRALRLCVKQSTILSNRLNR
jgi:hypothetical protein